MDKSRKSIGLMGNPNSGKSSLFNMLTGLRQQVGNFPGVTVDKKIGVTVLEDGTKVDVIDFPGSYSLFPNSRDERLVVNLIVDQDHADFPDLIVYVADITQLERHLLFATQLIDLEIPMVFCLNMVDLLDPDEDVINTEVLEGFLHRKVIPISTKQGDSLGLVKQAINSELNKPIGKAQSAIYHMSDVEKAASNRIKKISKSKNQYLNKIIGHHASWLTFLQDADRNKIKEITDKTGFNNIKLQIVETMKRFEKISPVAASTVQKKKSFQATFTDRIDKIVTHRWIGVLIFFVINFFIFQAVYAWTEYPMTWIEDLFTFLGNSVRGNIPAGWFTDLLVDGVIAGLGGILVFIPQITFLFLIIAVLEEIGYMARAVFLFDGIMQRFGLNGRSVVSLISSAACAIPAIMATRTIADWKERLITIMVAPLISCSARIPVYTVLIGFVVTPQKVFGVFNSQGLAFMGLYLIGIAASLISALVFKKILKSEDQSILMIELPQYKPPMAKNILLTVKEKVITFVVEAGKVILLISIILWFLASYGPSEKMLNAEKTAIELAEAQSLSEQETENLIASNKIEASYAGHLGKLIEPAIKPLGFDWKIGISLITSFAAREVFVGTMATIYSVGSADDEASVREKMAAEINRETMKPRFDMPTSLSLLIFYVFAMQCMSTLAVTKRETKSWKWPVIQFIYMGMLAYFGSLIVYQLLS